MSGRSFVSGISGQEWEKKRIQKRHNSIFFWNTVGYPIKPRSPLNISLPMRRNWVYSVGFSIWNWSRSALKAPYLFFFLNQGLHPATRSFLLFLPFFSFSRGIKYLKKRRTRFFFDFFMTFYALFFWFFYWSFQQ